MSFTVVRAVRGSDLRPPRPTEALRRVSSLPPTAGQAAVMDLPYAEEVLHLEISDFAQTIPGALESPAIVEQECDDEPRSPVV